MTALKQRLQRQLTSARQLSERLLEDFHAPGDWTRQVYPGCNHALWFAGHMGQVDNFFISILAPAKVRKREDIERLFGMGSQPTSDPGQYPPVAEVLEYMRERRQVLLEVLDQMQESDLAVKTPEGAPEFLADNAAVFEMAIWHEGMHSGQLTVVRRALGRPPVN